MYKKARAKTSTILIIVAVLLIVGFALGKSGIIYSITGNEQMTRTAPTQVNPNAQFTLTYTAVGTSGTFGASIEDFVTNCKFPDGTNSLKTVMLSSDGLTKTLTMTAPASGSCVFSNGNYKYGTSPILNFPTLTVTVCSPTCTRPSNLCTEASTVSNTCGGYCTGSWTITKNTNADIDCNNIVSRDELGTYINSWILGTVTRDNLGASIVAWIGTS